MRPLLEKYVIAADMDGSNIQAIERDLPSEQYNTIDRAAAAH